MRATDRELAAAAVLAGAAALAYETLWTRLLGLALGHEQLGVLAVLAGFFAGMAAGAWLTDARADSRHRPARVFAGLQLGAAGYAIAAPGLLTWFGGWLPSVLGLTPAPGFSLLAAALILLPATAALGASLPILIAARRKLASDDARGIARLYTFETVGAAIGVLVTVHLLLPRLGVSLSAAVAAALGLASAGAALLASDRSDADPTTSGAIPDAGSPDLFEARIVAESPDASRRDGPRHGLRPDPVVSASDDPDAELLRERWILYVAIGLTGLLGLGLEVVGVRVLAQLFSATIYSFADLLAVWLLGTAIGTGLHARLSTRALGRRPATVLVGLLWVLALTIAGAALFVRAAPMMLESFAPLGSGWARRQLAELGTAAIVLGPATVLIGAVFAQLLALIAAPSSEPGQANAGPRSVGAALAVNGLAAATAPFVFGLVALDALTYAEAWASIAWGYLVLALTIAWLRRFPPRQLAFASVVGGLALLGAGAGAGSLVLVKDEGEAWTVLERVEAPLGVVGVSETTQFPGSPERPLRRLRIDRHFRMGGSMSIGERRMGHLPLIAATSRTGAEQGDDAILFLGLGTGATAGAGLGYDIASLTAVELVPQVIDMLPHFEAVNAGLAKHPRANIIAADARRFLRADEHRYRVIVADLFHPARDGAGSLYAREHFVAARERLEHDGVFVQWLPLYQLDFATVRIIVATFTSVFTEAHAILALYNAETPALGLIGSIEPLVIELAELERVLASPERAAIYAELALLDPRDILAGYMLDHEGLLALAGDAPINDDLHPRVSLWAPKAEIGPLTGADNLERLLARRSSWPEGLIHDPDPKRLAAYRAASQAFADALGHYLRGEIALRRRLVSGHSVWTREILQHHLAAYLREPEFLPARPRLYAAARADPALAEWLLPAMIERTPNDPRPRQAWLAHLARTGDRDRLPAG